MTKVCNRELFADHCRFPYFLGFVSLKRNVFGVSINEFLIGISERNRQSVDIAIPPQHYLGDGEKKFMNGVLETLIQYLSTKEQ